MTYQLKLNDGTTRDLSFSLYFLNRLCKLSGVGLTGIFQYVMGDVSGLLEGRVEGGYLDDLEIRAQVVAAGMEAYDRARGNNVQYGIVEGFEIMEKMDQSLVSPDWAEIGKVLVQVMNPTGLPKDDAIKKNEEVSDLS